jgi:hypothetical protein
VVSGEPPLFPDLTTGFRPERRRPASGVRTMMLNADILQPATDFRRWCSCWPSGQFRIHSDEKHKETP